MRKRFKSLIVFFVTISLVSTLFAGCGGGKQENSAGTAQVTTGSQSAAPEEYKPKVDKITIQTNNRAVPDENLIKSWMEKGLGIKLNFIVISNNADIPTKLNLLIASNEMPDLMTLPNNHSAEYFKYVDQGLLADMDPLLKYAPNVAKARTKEQIDALRWKDGKLYALNSNAETSFDMLLLRQDWLTKLNLKAPATLDELTNVMRAFVTKDPDGNGKEDTTGYQGWGGLANFNNLWTAFGANPFQWILKDGKVVHGAMQPEVKEAVKYLRMLFQEGLMDKEYLTVDLAKKNEKVSTGKTGIVHDQLWYASPEYSIYHQDPKADWIAIGPPKGPGGKSGYYTSESPTVRQYTMISKSSKDPVMAMKYLNFIADYENLKKIRIGDKGEHYNVENGKIVVPDKYLKDNSLLIQQGITATYAMLFFTQDPLKEQYAGPCHDIYRPLRRQNEKATYGAIYGAVPKIVEKQLGAGWDSAYNKVINKLIIEGGDIDNEFNEVVKLIYDKYGMKEQEQYANEYYNEMNKKK